MLEGVDDEKKVDIHLRDNKVSPECNQLSSLVVDPTNFASP